MKSAAIVTPSIGSPHLEECILSVQQQSFANLSHYIIVDGKEHAPNVRRVAERFGDARHPIHIIYLPENTGGARFHGYRICSAFSILVNQEVTFFLDDDNCYAPEHVAEGMNAIQDFDVDWGYCLRRLITQNGVKLLDDNCDSLGFWRRAESYLGPADGLAEEFCLFFSTTPCLVDTSCFFARTEFIRGLAHLLLKHPKGDAYFSSLLVRQHPGACTGRFDMNYRVRALNEKRTMDYFLRGNQAMEKRYQGSFPWLVRQRRESLNASS